MKILFVSHSSQLYGSERSLLDILRTLRGEWIEPYLACPGEGLLAQEAEKLKIKVFSDLPYYWAKSTALPAGSPQRLATKLRAIYLIRKMVRQEKIDLIYTNSYCMNSGAIAGKVLGIPHIWHIREPLRVPAKQTRIVDAFSNHVIVNSIATRDLFPKRLWRKISVVYNGFNVARRDPSDSAEQMRIRTKLGLSQENTVIGMIGSISPRKGQRDLIFAIPQLMKNWPGIQVLIAGDSQSESIGYERELDRTIEENRLQHVVRRLGFVQNVEEIYRVCDLVAVPSHLESFGRVVVETLLAQRPLVATRVGGIPEIVQGTKTAILVEPGRPEMLTRAIHAMLWKKEKIVQELRRTREIIAERFRMDKMSKALEHVIGKVGNIK